MRIALRLWVATAGLLAAWVLQHWLQAWNLAYYGLFSVPSSNVTEEGAAEGLMAMGACDLFMYQGGESLSGFLSFLLLYGAFVAVGLGLVRRAPERLQRPLLLAWSGLFLLVALPPVAAVRMAELALGLFLICRLPVSGKVRSWLLVAAVALFLPTGGRSVLEACAGEHFTAHALGRELSFPRLFLALALLVKTFRRVLWLAFESESNRLSPPDLADFLLYLLGLPFLLGNAVTPPYGGFRDARGRGPTPEQGAATLAWCWGVTPVLLTLLVMMAYSPAVRLFFPHCDLHHATPLVIAGRLLATYPVEFLFLLASEQASVGVARLFGWGLKDNFQHPMTAPDVAAFWRRWNIYWRDYLVAAWFYPTALALGRRTGGRRTWHLVVATGVTFGATWLLNLVPLALLGGLAEEAVVWRPLIASMALYYGLEGLAVAAVLVAEARRGGRPSRIPVWLGAVGTFAFIALARGFLNPMFSAGEQLLLLARMVGL